MDRRRSEVIFQITPPTDGSSGTLHWCPRHSLEGRVHVRSCVPSCDWTVRDRFRHWTRSCVDHDTLDQCSHRASALDVLVGGGRGYHHETCSINQTILCSRAPARSQRVRESWKLSTPNHGKATRFRRETRCKRSLTC